MPSSIFLRKKHTQIEKPSTLLGLRPVVFDAEPGPTGRSAYAVCQQLVKSDHFMVSKKFEADRALAEPIGETGLAPPWLLRRSNDRTWKRKREGMRRERERDETRVGSR